MSKERVCANTPALSRRSALAGLAATCATAPAIASEGESEIMALFREHQAYRDWMNDLPLTWSDEDLEPHYQHLFAIAARMMALPSTSAADFAAKAIVDSCDGGLISCWETGDFWIEARKLTGTF